MNSQSISKFTITMESFGNYNDNLISPLVSIPLLDDAYRGVFGDASDNYITSLYKSEKSTNFANLNTFYNQIATSINLSNIGLFPKLTETIFPVGFGNNNFPLKLSSGIDIADLPAFSANNNIFGLSFNFAGYNQLPVTNQINNITWNVLGEKIDHKIQNLLINEYDPFLKANSLYNPFQDTCSSLSNIKEINHDQGCFNLSNPIFSLPLLSLSSFEENLLNFKPLLHPSTLDANQASLFTKEIGCYLNNNCITEISTNNWGAKLLFKHSVHSFHYDAYLSKISHKIELSERDIASYNQLVIKEHHKQNQGKGGSNKRVAEKAFFLSKFSELRGLDHKSEDRDIVYKIWNEYNSMGKELSNLSKARGFITLMEWYRKYIAKSA